MRGIGPRSAAADPCPRQQFGRHAGFAPCGVLNAFALGIRGGVFNKGGFDAAHVGFVSQGGELCVDASAVLHQLQPLDGLDVTCGKLRVDAGTPLVELLGCDSTAGLRLVRLQSIQVVAHRPGFDSSRGDCCLVLITHLAFCHRVSLAAAGRFLAPRVSQSMAGYAIRGRMSRGFSYSPVMSDETVDAVEVIGFADSYFDDIVGDACFWPVCVRDIGEVFFLEWAENESDGWGYRAMADAALYELRLETGTRGGEHGPFVPYPVDEDRTPSPMPLSYVPQRTLDLWDACANHERWVLNPLLRARLIDLLWARGHGNLAQNSREAICAYLEIADLEPVDAAERLRGLLRAYELCCHDAHFALHDQVMSRIRSFIDKHPETAAESGFEHVESLALIREHTAQHSAPAAA